MLIKQWAETQNPRHLLADDENVLPPQILKLELVVSTSTEPALVFVVPQSLTVTVDSIQTKSKVGECVLEFCGGFAAETKSGLDDTQDFDDDEQLYAALRDSAKKSCHCPIYAVGPQQSTFVVVLPHVGDVLAEKVLALLVASLVPENGSWLAMAPSSLGYNQSVCRLDLGSAQFSEVDPLRPPHYVSGFVAAFVSAMVDRGLEKDGNVLVLHSEGQIGFEKVDADAIVDAAHHTARLLVGEADKGNYLEKLSRAVRRITLSTTSGMYL